jgi:hypothetical protein
MLLIDFLEHPISIGKHLRAIKYIGFAIIVVIVFICQLRVGFAMQYTRILA